jgi:hypothetical protein
MTKGPRLDLRRLERETAAADARTVQLAPGGRPATGLMQLVRENLDALVALQADGRTWGAIAAGLTAQGFRAADGRDLTAANLTGVISSVRRQAARRLAREATRRARADAVPVGVHADPVPTRVGLRPTPSSTLPRDDGASRLAPELRPRSPGPAEEGPPSEAEIRRIQAERHSHLFKKD